MTKFYIDADGNYLGGFDGADPPDGAVEVSSAPHDARQVWSDGAWGDVPPPEALAKPPVARITLVDGQVSGIVNGDGLAGGVNLGDNAFWLFFVSALPGNDTDYLAAISGFDPAAMVNDYTLSTSDLWFQFVGDEVPSRVEIEIRHRG